MLLQASIYRFEDTLYLQGVRCVNYFMVFRINEICLHLYSKINLKYVNKSIKEALWLVLHLLSSVCDKIPTLDLSYYKFGIEEGKYSNPQMEKACFK